MPTGINDIFIQILYLNVDFDYFVRKIVQRAKRVSAWFGPRAGHDIMMIQQLRDELENVRDEEWGLVSKNKNLFFSIVFFISVRWKRREKMEVQHTAMTAFNSYCRILLIEA